MENNSVRVISIKDCSEIDVINDAIHDCWFDVANISVDHETSVFKLIYEKEMEEQAEVIKDFYLMRKVKVPVIECYLLINNVKEYKMQDSENVGRYDLTYIDCNESLGEIAIVTGVPISITLKVSSTSICVEMTDKVIEHKTKFTL